MKRFLLWEVEYVGFRPTAWKGYARQSLKISVIKAYRELKNKGKTADSPDYLSLREAKNFIEDWMQKHHVKGSDDDF